MNPSKYLKAFKDSAVTLDIPGDAILVEQVKAEEVRSGSGKIIIAQATSHKTGDQIAANLPLFVYVLQPGKGYYDAEDLSKPDTPVAADVGDIILVGQNSVRWFGSLDIKGYEPFTIGITREAEIQMRFKGIEEYRQVFGRLNQAVEEKMDQ